SYKVLIGILSVFILYNIYATITTRNLIGILPILIQSVLIYLLITKNIISQKAVKVWIIVVLFGAQGLILIGIVMQSWAKYMKDEENALEMLTSNKVIYSLIIVAVGVIIWILNNNFGKLIENNERLDTENELNLI
ncbi:MAG: hypothetical protein ACI920_003503, partial [Saprospiraceae bacterium]